MAKNKFLWRLSFIMAAVVVMVMVSCATQVPIKLVKMPTIDTSGMQRMAIKPFTDESGFGGTASAQLPRYLTDQATQKITAAGKFTMVAPTDPSADGVFTGTITNISSKDSQSQSQRKDQDGNVQTVTTYRRDVVVEFSYSVISSRTDVAVGTVFKKGSSSDTSTNSASGLTDTTTLAKQAIDTQIANLQNDLVPYIVSENRKLMSETSKDKVVKQKMKDVLVLVKRGDYEEAITQYDAINKDHGSIAAKTNANLLRDVVSSDIAARSQLSELFNDKDGLAERAIKSTMDNLNSKLPAGAKITLMKTSSQEQVMLDYIVDNMTKTIVEEKKFAIMDRSNKALIDAEVNLQMSGSVSDDSIISIGHQLGVQYIVLCGISGEKSLRRFNLKVLNIETTQITVQTDTEI